MYVLLCVPENSTRAPAKALAQPLRWQEPTFHPETKMCTNPRRHTHTQNTPFPLNDEVLLGAVCWDVLLQWGGGGEGSRLWDSSCSYAMAESGFLSNTDSVLWPDSLFSF